MVSIWLPDGKCPSFADILKRSSYAGSADLVDKGNSKYLAGVKICHIFTDETHCAEISDG
jgi:hypothetical protein